MAVSDRHYYTERAAFVRFGNAVIRTASILAVRLDLDVVRPGKDHSETCVEIIFDANAAFRLFDDEAEEARKWFTDARIETP